MLCGYCTTVLQLFAVGSARLTDDVMNAPLSLLRRRRRRPSREQRQKAPFKRAGIRTLFICGPTKVPRRLRVARTQPHTLHASDTATCGEQDTILTNKQNVINTSLHFLFAANRRV